MKFLIRSAAGETLSLCLRLLNEGNQVKFSIVEKDYQKIGNGLVEKPLSFEGGVNWAEVVVFDGNIFGMDKEAERVRMVKPVMGSGKLAGQLEQDRAFATQFAKSCGLRTNPYKEFSGPRAWDMARAYLKTQGMSKYFVWKPNGESPASTYVEKGIPEMFRMFKYWEQLYKDHNEEPNFILTEKVDGSEISTEAWFNGRDFTLPNHTLERNRFFDGDHGEKTGCAGNIVWIANNAPLVKALLEPLRESLTDKYWGPIDVNAIIEEKSGEPLFLEFSSRFGYDAIFALLELVKSDLGELLYSMAVGAEWRGGAWVGEYAGAVRVHIPPYPEPPASEDARRAEGVPVFGWRPEKWSPHFSPVEIMVNREDEVVTSGPDGYAFVVSDTDKTIDGAMEKAYGNVEKLRIPNMRYRMDLGEMIKEEYEKVEATGWLGGVVGRGPVSLTDLLSQPSLRRRAY
jgi:phosphoribosylamine-glycine ligase